MRAAGGEICGFDGIGGDGAGADMGFFLVAVDFVDGGGVCDGVGDDVRVGGCGGGGAQGQD